MFLEIFVRNVSILSKIVKSLPNHTQCFQCLPNTEDRGQSSVQDVTWMSDQSMHLAEWMGALEQVN